MRCPRCGVASGVCSSKHSSTGSSSSIRTMTSAPSGPKYVPKHGRAAGQSVLRMRGLPRLFWRWMLHSQRIIAGIMRMFGISGYCRCNDQSRIDALARVSTGGITQQDVGPQRDGTRKEWPRQAARRYVYKTISRSAVSSGEKTLPARFGDRSDCGVDHAPAD